MQNGGRVVLVTGGDSENGAAIAARFGDAGYSVVACCAAVERATATASVIQGLGPRGKLIQADVRNPKEAQRVVDETAQAFGRIDVLVNAGASRRIIGTIAEVTDEDFDEEMTTDLKSVIYMSRAVVPIMASGGGGTIVNLSSIARSGVRGRALRSMSKAALSSLTRAMALDHGAQGIRVNALLIGPTHVKDRPFPPEQLARLEAEAALGSINTPEDVAAAALFFASDDAKRITGVLLPIDAGRSLASF